MQNAFRFLLGLALAAPLFAQRDIGVVDVAADISVIALTVSSSSPDLQNLALIAFNTHGRYRLVASGGAYTVDFAPAGANHVALTITKGSAGTPGHSPTVSGNSPPHPLPPPADLPPANNNGL